MLSNLSEDEIKLTGAEIKLIKEIFEAKGIDWKKNWSWIDEFKVIDFDEDLTE